MFDTLLVANRGEIACRVMRTARRLGLRTVAVYSDADRDAMHVEMADIAVRIGPPAARESYLDGQRILEAARQAGAQAIHPGYGFLAENAEFASACVAAGFVFVGPPAAAIRAMGSKIGAKRLMESSGVPLVPGYHGEEQDDATLLAAAARIGFPILVKASAGGGGKGMRVAHDDRELPAQLDSARREALKAFGDDRLLLERYLQQPRHIEIQVFADAHGNCIHLHERDCSLQRRHQKIVEEAPAPGLSPERRAAMGEAAIRAARRVGYVGAGTVEFIAAGDGFYFMEMNTRLQVEHPVTEMITGLDLVEWQLRIAAGKPLPLTQEQVALDGHAIEARLYAEDPDREFLPSTGRLRHLRWPDTNATLRIDTGVREGDEVTVHYDPMLAKLVAWGENRIEAVAALHRALARCEVAGVATNLGLLHAITAAPDFRAGRIHTGFIPEHAQELFRAPDPVSHRQAAALAVLGFLQQERDQAVARADAGAWSAADGWRLNANASFGLRLHDAASGKPIEVRVEELQHRAPGGASSPMQRARICIDGARFELDDIHLSPGRVRARVDTGLVEAGWRVAGQHGYVFRAGRAHVFSRVADRDARGSAAEVGSLRSPMPGQVIQVLVTPGAQVRRGQPLMIVEAMKMEHTVVAPADGIVETVGFATGARVEEGAQLLRLRSAGEGPGTSGA
jgi:3-methylcrotonyl-CoA carboxylase alpha subunit